MDLIWRGGDSFGEDLQVDGDEFAVLGFDEVAAVGVGDFGAGFRVFPVVVAGSLIAIGLEPCGDFIEVGAVPSTKGWEVTRAGPVAVSSTP